MCFLCAPNECGLVLATCVLVIDTDVLRQIHLFFFNFNFILLTTCCSDTIKKSIKRIRQNLDFRTSYNELI